MASFLALSRSLFVCTMAGCHVFDFFYFHILILKFTHTPKGLSQGLLYWYRFFQLSQTYTQIHTNTYKYSYPPLIQHGHRHTHIHLHTHCFRLTCSPFSYYDRSFFLPFFLLLSTWLQTYTHLWNTLHLPWFVLLLVY